MKTGEHCILWDRTRDLATDHGFEMSVLCPMDAICDGSRCSMIDPIKKTADNVEKFYHTLEEHQTKVKLMKLREELRQMDK